MHRTAHLSLKHLRRGWIARSPVLSRALSATHSLGGDRDPPQRLCSLWHRELLIRKGEVGVFCRDVLQIWSCLGHSGDVDRVLGPCLLLREFSPSRRKQTFCTSSRSQCTKIAQLQSLAISALMEPNRQKSCRKKGFRAQKSQLEIANR